MNSNRDPSQFNDIPDPLVDGGIGLPLPARPLVPRSLHRWPTIGASIGARRSAALAVAIASQVAWVALLTRRSDIEGSSRVRLALEFAFPLVTAAIAFWAAGAPGRRGLGNTRAKMAIAIASAACVFAAGAWLMAAVGETDSLPFWFHVARCTAYIAGFAMVPFALALWANARAFVTLSSWRTCALGVGCGAVGACTMIFICETESAAHVIIGHGLALVIGGLVGALAARRVTMA